MTISRLNHHRRRAPSRQAPASPAPRRRPLSRTGWPRACLLLATAVFCSACSSVQPWERELLAEPAMQLDAQPLRQAVDDHIHFSKESASGGRGFGGGGCGCN